MRAPACDRPARRRPPRRSELTGGDRAHVGRRGAARAGVAKIPGLLCCGDSTFPGIGVPAVAASGLTAANTLVSVDQHMKLLEQMKRDGLMPDQCMV